jgi:Flp pilus assembly protein TadG
VKKSFKHKFIKNQDGISLVEALITFPVLLLTIAVFVEFGFMVFQYNQTAKAVQLGARLASVSTPLAADMSAFMSALTDDYDGSVDPVPATPASFICGDTSVCDTDGINRLIQGSDGVCDTSVGASVPGMCDFNPSIGSDNVIVSYHRSGLGYQGRIGGPIVTVTVQVKDLQWNLPILGRLLDLANVTIPSHPVSVTSEDLCTSKGLCP